MSKMANFRGQWSQAPVMYTSEFDTPEDGTYRCAIEDVKYSETDRNGNPTDPTFIYILRVKEGNGLGMRFRKFVTIKNDKNLSFLKGDLTRLGLVVPADPEEIMGVFQSAHGLTVDVTVKTRHYQGKPYKDCTIDRLIKEVPHANPFAPNGVPYTPAQGAGPQEQPPFDADYYDNLY